MGLPDLTPVHDAYVDKMKKVVAEGMTPDAVNETLKTWSPMGEASLNMWKTMFDQMSGKK